MKKLNLLTISVLVIGIGLVSCTKEFEVQEDVKSETPSSKDVNEVKCWDLNNNGEADTDEDKNKDGKVDNNDCVDQ
jgi:ABC-type glycerol-3-phosphate transport system substrate-binding protein